MAKDSEEMRRAVETRFAHAERTERTPPIGPEFLLPPRGGALPDWMIEQRIALGRREVLKPPAERNNDYLVIHPFSQAVKIRGVVSYGLSSYGYDIRLGRNFLIFNDVLMNEIDPLTLAATIDERVKKGQFFQQTDVDHCVIPPNSFCLAESMEWFRIPRDCIAQVWGKSTYARCGINLPMTPLEPAWDGVVTIEIANSTRLPARVHSNHGIGQVLFQMGAAPCRTSYAEKEGASYQGQTGLTLPTA